MSPYWLNAARSIANRYGFFITLMGGIQKENSIANATYQ
jgi:hypothetical protein